MDCPLDKQVREVTDDWVVDTDVVKRTRREDAELRERLQSLVDKYKGDEAKAYEELKKADTMYDRVTSKVELRSIRQKGIKTNNTQWDPVFVKQGHNKVLLSDDVSDYAKYMDEIEEYTGTGYMELADIRKGKAQTLGINTMLDNTKANFYGYTYRGTRLTKEQSKSFKVGTILTNKVPISTTKEFIIANNFVKGDVSKDIKDTIIYFKTTGHDIQKYSGLPREQEVLLNKGKYFQILSRHDTDLTSHILVEEISPELVPLLPADIAKTINSKVLGLGFGILGVSNIDK